VNSFAYWIALLAARDLNISESALECYTNKSVAEKFVDLTGAYSVVAGNSGHCVLNRLPLPFQYVKPGYARWGTQCVNERVTRMHTPPFPMFHVCNRIGIMRFHQIGTVLMRLDVRLFVRGSTQTANARGGKEYGTQMKRAFHVRNTSLLRRSQAAKRLEYESLGVLRAGHTIGG